MERVAAAYYRAIDAVAVTRMRIFAIALGLPERHFVAMVNRLRLVPIGPARPRTKRLSHQQGREGQILFFGSVLASP
jgi:isopenicillin N synthase-like dioxygenase